MLSLFEQNVSLITNTLFNNKEIISYNTQIEFKRMSVVSILYLISETDISFKQNYKIHYQFIENDLQKLSQKFMELCFYFQLIKNLIFFPFTMYHNRGYFIRVL